MRFFRWRPAIRSLVGRAVAYAGSVYAGRLMPGTVWCRYGASLVLALALLSCTGGESDLTGTWTGTITDSVAGIGTLSLTITQTDSQLTGTWQSTFADSTDNNGGNLSGSVAAASIALVLSAAQPQACSLTVAVTRDNEAPDHFTGTYVAFNCARAESGSLEVTRHSG